MKHEGAYENQNVHLKINIYLIKHPLCDLGPCCHHIETSLLIHGANPWDSFCTMARLE